MITRTGPAVATALLLSIAGLGAGCGDDRASTTASTTSAPGPTAEPVIDPGDGGDYQPSIDAADFVDGVDNPYLPLTPGARWVYESVGGDETERIEVEVLDERHEVFGVSAVVVRDQAFVDGELVEDTLDWFAQDGDGIVWYLGEDTAEYENGEIINHDGSWAAGIDGALPGIVMPAAPAVGDAYRQEFLAGEAEDLGEVLETSGTATVALGTFDDVVVTEDWTPLQADTIEHKSYAPGIGLILEEKVTGAGERVELIEFTPGR